MKVSILFAAVAALAVPATAAPVKRDAAPMPAPDAQLDWSNGNPFGQWNDDGSFKFTINWSDAVSRWRTRRPPQATATPSPQAPAPQPTPEPQPEPEQPAPEPEQPAPQPEQPAPEPSKSAQTSPPCPLVPKPTPKPEQPAPQPEQPAPKPEQPAPEPEQPAPQPEQPSPQPEQPAPAPVDSSSVAERPADAPTPTPSATSTNEPAATPAAEKVAGQPTLPFANDLTLATQDSTAADIAGTTAQAKLALDYHNQWRAQFGVPALQWDAGLAQKAANAMGTCKWEHIGADNLSALWGSGSVNFPVHKLIAGWANEWRLYDWNNPGFSMETGHFTAMTWKAVTKVGCGWKIGCKDASPGAGNDKKIFFQCVYDPTPNMGGWDAASTRKNYAENVPRFVGN
ncbi:unnamed protein product [Cutaneotrichosporon oleaginosum]